MKWSWWLNICSRWLNIGGTECVGTHAEEKALWSFRLFDFYADQWLFLSVLYLSAILLLKSITGTKMFCGRWSKTRQWRFILILIRKRNVMLQIFLIFHTCKVMLCVSATRWLTPWTQCEQICRPSGQHHLSCDPASAHFSSSPLTSRSSGLDLCTRSILKDATQTPS